MLYLSTTQGVFRVNPDTGVVARLGPSETSTEGLAVTPTAIVAAVTPDYGTPMRNPLRPASRRGAVRSVDGGLNWAPVADGLSGAQVTALGAAASGGVLFAGTDPAEVLASRDGGATWTQGQSLREMPGYDRWSYPLAPHTPHVMLFAPHPRRPETVFAGIEVGGIARSDDGGATWRMVGARGAGAIHPDLHGMAICAAAPETIYAATPQGVYVSDDGGESWQQRIEGLEPLYCRPIVVHGAEPSTAVVVATHGASGFFGIPAERTGGAVFRTQDSGRTWRQVTHGLPSPLAPTPAMAADPGVPQRFYLPLFSGDVYVSDDAGATWRELAAGLPPILRSVAT
jgi:photosystem II stability/assembly factor-like uncharacterized protein